MPFRISASSIKVV